jgi:hypothetical protein
VGDARHPSLVIAFVVLRSERLQPEPVCRQLERYVEVVGDEGGGHETTRYGRRPDSPMARDGERVVCAAPDAEPLGARSPAHVREQPGLQIGVVCDGDWWPQTPGARATSVGKASAAS